MLIDSVMTYIGVSVWILIGITLKALFSWGANPDRSRRSIALVLDLFLISFILGNVVIMLVEGGYASGLDSSTLTQVVLVAAFIAPPLIWALFESSGYRATPGKLLFKLAVSNRNKSKPSFTQAFIRNTVKWVSIANWPLFLLNIAFFHYKGHALHDLVVKGFTSRLPEDIGRKLGDTKIYVSNYQENFDFNDHEDAGQYGEMLLLKELERLKSEGKILDYGTTRNMVFRNRNFEMDAYALVQNVGIIVMEAKFYSGKIYPTGFDMWDNVKPDGTNSPKKNPCLQIERTTTLFCDLLDSRDINKWPVYPCVVIAHPNTQLVWGESAPQYFVIRLDMLEDQLSDGVDPDARIVFSDNDHDEIRQLLEEHEKEYIDRSPEFA
ncbi:MAG: RDD family protein [Sedimenticola sp.]